MDLHGLVRGAIQTVNPDITATLLRSTGYSTGASGKQTPTYASLSGAAQVQPAGWKDLQQLNALNIQGVARSVYLYGNWMGVVRVDDKGGDVLNFPQIPGAAVQSWKVVAVPETWPDWCRVLVVLQTALVAA